MRKTFILLALALARAEGADPNKSNQWSAVASPWGTVSRAIGSYAHGCQSGAIYVPEQGPGYVSIRRWRNRFFTQPVTRALIEHVGASVAPRRLLVGDMSLPIGGRMPFGHASHQNGLDVDFWFSSVGPEELPPADIEPPTMADKYNGQLYRERWRPEYRQALWAAATFPETARLFVNPVIKVYLCESESDRSWLHKVRPWGGHDAHFHVRLNCPPDSPSCEPQKPIPPGDGCDAALYKWVNDQAEALRNPKPPRPPRPERPKPLHPECQALLNGQPLN